MHSNGIAHRDIKGANILVTDTGIVKLADFGASKQRQLNEDSLDRPFQSLKGTPCFMAPEVIRQKGYGSRADIWSLGCTILEMIAGRPPWSEKRDNSTIMYKIATTTSPPKFPQSLSNTGKDFLKRCFERNPIHRATALELLMHPFLSNAAASDDWHRIPPTNGAHSLDMLCHKSKGLAGDKDTENGSSGRGSSRPPRPSSSKETSRPPHLIPPNLLSELSDVLQTRAVKAESGRSAHNQGAAVSKKPPTGRRTQPGAVEASGKGASSKVPQCANPPMELSPSFRRTPAALTKLNEPKAAMKDVIRELTAKLSSRKIDR